MPKYPTGKHCGSSTQQEAKLASTGSSTQQEAKPSTQRIARAKQRNPSTRENATISSNSKWGKRAERNSTPTPAQATHCTRATRIHAQQMRRCTRHGRTARLCDSAVQNAHTQTRQHCCIALRIRRPTVRFPCTANAQAAQPSTKRLQHICVHCGFLRVCCAMQYACAKPKTITIFLCFLRQSICCYLTDINKHARSCHFGRHSEPKT